MEISLFLVFTFRALICLCPNAFYTYAAKNKEHESLVPPSFFSAEGGSSFPEEQAEIAPSYKDDQIFARKTIHSLFNGRIVPSDLQDRMIYAPGSREQEAGDEPRAGTTNAAATAARALNAIGDAYFRKVGQEIEGAVYDYLFGSSVSLSEDGKYLAIAGSVTNNLEDGPASGLVQVYKYYQANSGNWAWQQYGQDITTFTSGLRPHIEVAMNCCGKILAIANVYKNMFNAEPVGTVTFYENSDGTKWVQKGSEILGGESGEDMSGLKIAISHDGWHAVIGSPYYSKSTLNDVGRVRVYDYKNTTGEWAQIGPDINGTKTGDKLGSSVALIIVDNLLYVASGATGKDTATGTDSGHVEVHRWDESEDEWAQHGQNIIGEAAGDESGFSVALAYTIELKLRIAIGAVLNDGADGNKSTSGHVRIYDYSSASQEWEQIGSDLDGESGAIVGNGCYRTGDFFGFSVDLSKDGSRIVAGAPLNNGGTTYYGGHARVFDFDTGTERWIQVAEDIDGTNSDDTTGHSVSISADGRTIAIGGPGSSSEQSAGGVIVWKQEVMTAAPSIVPSVSVSPTNQPTLKTRYDSEFMVVEVRSESEALCTQKLAVQTLVFPILEESIGNTTLDTSIDFETNCSYQDENRRYLQWGEWYFRFVVNFIQASRDENTFKEPAEMIDLMNKEQNKFIRLVEDEVGVVIDFNVFSINAPSASPSSSTEPSSSAKPSSKPTATESPSLSLAPTILPTATQNPSVSSQPTAFLDRGVFNIVTDSDKFDGIIDSNVCLTAKYIAPASSLHMRPCNKRFARRQTWIQTGDGSIKLRGFGDYTFCIEYKGRKLVLKQCSPNSPVFEELHGYSKSIEVTKPNGTYYVGFDPMKFFSKLQLYKAGDDNSSLKQWRLVFIAGDDGSN